MRWTMLVWTLVPIAVACETPKTVALPSASPTTSAASAGDAALPMLVDAAAPLGSIRVESPFPGGVAIVNDSDAPVGIERVLPIERLDAGVWSTAHGMEMKQKCDAPPLPDCVTIAAHSRYEPLPWTGWLGCTQCGSCRANAPARIGKYRVVAVECPGGVRHDGPAMELVGEGRFAGAPHVFSSPGAPSSVQIDNDSDVPMSFAANVEVMVLDKTRNAWDAIDGAKMSLSPTCGADAGTCLTVPAHGSVTSMAYRPGCAPCTKCAAASAKPGTYELRVSVCPGSKPLYNDVYGRSFYTEPFSVAYGGAVRQGE